MMFASRRNGVFDWLVHLALASLSFAFPSGPSLASADVFNGIIVPGKVITHVPAASGSYIGSPSLAVLPNGDYVTSHDEFGPNTSADASGTTHLFKSADRGQTWAPLTDITDQFWSNLFVHQGDLYIMGTRYGASDSSSNNRDLLIRRSADGGATWSTPTDVGNGLLAQHPLGSAGFHTAPVPVVEHGGRLWRALEISRGDFRPVMISAPVDSDLLDASNWKFTNTLASHEEWLPNNGFNFWMEGNAVVGPGGELVNVMRISVNRGQPERVAIVKVENTDHVPYLRFDPANDIVAMPGGAKKFTIRYDEASSSYWTLSNIVNDRNYDPNATPGGIRNMVALLKSPDLRTWETRQIVLEDLTDVDLIGFQYLDWQFDGDDIVAVSRTAFPDGLGGAHNFHDANFLTFHRVENFRTAGLAADSHVPEPSSLALLAYTAVGLIVFAGRNLRVRPCHFSLTLIVSILCAVSQSAHANLLVAESFNYPAGNLHGRNGGTGWFAPWQISDTTGTATVTASGLQFSDLLVAGGAARMELTASGGFVGMAANRTLAVGAAQGADLWVRFLYRQPHGPLEDPSSRIAEIRINTLKLRVRPKQSHLQGVALAYDGQIFGDNNTYNVQDGNTYLMIARFADLGQSAGDGATMWVLDSPRYDAIKHGGVTVQELDKHSLMILTDPHDQQSLNAGERVQLVVADSSGTNFTALFDELRYGMTLADVLPGIGLIPGDLNHDGAVDDGDLGIWTASFGEDPAGDANGDGKADGADWLLWQRNYGLAAIHAESSSVPEMASMKAMTLLSLGLAISRRRSSNLTPSAIEITSCPIRPRRWHGSRLPRQSLR